MLTALNDDRFVRAIHWRIWLCQIALLVLMTPAFTFWSQAIFGLLLLAKLDQIYFNRPVWSLGRSNLLAVLVLAVFLIMWKELGVIHLMFHFLLLASLLRLLSIRSDDLADYRQLLWVHYFLIASCFIVHQNLAFALCILLLLALQVQIQHLLFAGRLMPIQWKKLSVITLVFVPVFLALFVFFPRLPPLWQLPSSKAAETGLANDLSPGKIEQLVSSDELAFRVTFEGEHPKQNELYWRAKIYNRFDGTTWHAEGFGRARAAPATQAEWQYTVFTEPHQQRMLFSLGHPSVLHGTVQINSRHLVRADQEVSQRFSYRLTGIDTPFPDPTPAKSYSLLPPGNPKSRELAASLQALKDPELIVAALKTHFSGDNYIYTLTPKALSGDEIDQFLFESKAGFCSHYASASVFLLRAAGVPSRIIGGYLGGVWQDDKSYLQVRQREAHAWVEYYSDGFWHRFDPTAVVAPGRLENGLDQILADSELSLLQQSWGNNTNLVRYIIGKLESLDFYWSKWVIAFNEQQQTSLLDELKASWQELSLLQIGKIIATTILFGLMLMPFRWWLRREKVSKPVQLFRPLERLITKQPTESYQHFLGRVASLHPATADICQQLTEQYGAWVFAEDKTAGLQSRRLMRQLLKRIDK
jgi:transglutaminase-like putative cysteine protease